MPHPIRCDASLYPAFDLVLSSKILYDDLVKRVGEHLGVDSTRVQLWRINSATGEATAIVERGANRSLHMILNAVGYSQPNPSQKPNMFYVEILEPGFSGLDNMENLRIDGWLGRV
jgi:hypothetical protein